MQIVDKDGNPVSYDAFVAGIKDVTPDSYRVYEYTGPPLYRKDNYAGQSTAYLSQIAFNTGNQYGIDRINEMYGLPPSSGSSGVGAGMVSFSRLGALIGTRPGLNVIPGSGMTVAMADNAGQNRVDLTLSATGGGGAVDSMPTLRQFNVDDYGAVGDGTTDDYNAWRDAWADLTAWILSGKDGVLVYGKGDSGKTYRIDVTGRVTVGAQQQYAVFKVPMVAHNTTHPMRVMGLVGPGIPTVGRQFPGIGNNVAPSHGSAVIKVTYAGPFSWSSSNGHPSLFGGPDFDFASNGLTNVHWYMEGVCVRQPDNPSLCNFNLEGLQCATVVSYYADTDTFPDASVTPTHTTGCVILWPAPGNAAVLRAGAIGCWGYFAGVGHGEHLMADYLYLVHNRLAMPGRRASDHFSLFSYVANEENLFGLAGYDPSTTNGVVDIPNTTVMVIQMMDIEDFPANSGDLYTPDAGCHVLDTNNHLRGFMNFAGINSGTTSPTGLNDKLYGFGATGFRKISLLDGAAKTLSTGHNPTDPTGGATVPGTPTGVSATGGDAQATVAFTAPGSNGGSTITGYTATSTPGSHTGTASGPGSGNIVVTGLTNGTAYTFTVHATNAIGNSAESSASNSVTPAASSFETLFTTEDPSSTGGFQNANDSSPYMLGTLFVCSVNRHCAGGRWWFPTTLPGGAVKLSLWTWDSDTTGTKLAEATFSSPTAGTWNEVQFGSPVALTAGVKYVMEVHTPDRYAGKAGFLTGHTQTSSGGNATAPADDTVTPVRNGRLNLTPSTDADYAGQAAGGSCYFVDVLLTA